MRWLLLLVCVNCLISSVLYPMLMLGVDKPISWLVEISLLAAGGGALYLLVRYRKSF